MSTRLNYDIQYGDRVDHPTHGRGEVDHVTHDEKAKVTTAHVQYERDGRNVSHPTSELRKRSEGHYKVNPNLSPAQFGAS